jgi:hypothetical protein
MMADIQKELALRLAWYIDRYGEIPQRDQAMLWGVATGRLQDESAVRLSELTNEILEYFQSIS